MSVHRDLLDVASHLAKRDRGRPRQANLRRAVSTAYYAVFHLLTDAVARRLVGASSERTGLREATRRALGHGHMKDVAKGFGSGAPKAPWARALNGPVGQDVQRVANAFVALQEARHRADYDLGTPFTRQETLAAVQLAREAFAAWEKTRSSEGARVFLVALAFQAHLKTG